MSSLNSQKQQISSSPFTSFSQSSNQVLNNQHNITKVPFGLKSKRFDWQTGIEKNYLDELYGNTKDFTKRKNSSTWEDFVNKINKTDNKEKKKRRSKTYLLNRKI